MKIAIALMMLFSIPSFAQDYGRQPAAPGDKYICKYHLDPFSTEYVKTGKTISQARTAALRACRADRARWRMSPWEERCLFFGCWAGVKIPGEY